MLVMKRVATGPSKTLVLADFSQISRVLQNRFFSSSVRLAVSILIRNCLEVSIFFLARGLQVLIRSFTCSYY